jgi:hypothetical protein
VVQRIGSPCAFFDAQGDYFSIYGDVPIEQFKEKIKRKNFGGKI